jgi:hypothetical protein
MICFRCGKENPVIGGIVGRGDSCLQCGGSLKVCKNCDFYDVKAYNECRESSADRVVDKDKSNFCDYFVPSSRGILDSKPKLDPLAAAEALFKKK